MRDYERGTPVEPVDMPVQNTGTYQDGLRLTEPVPEPALPRPLTKQQLLCEYEIRIRFLSKGCVVSVGCKDLAFNSVEEAMASIEKYVEDPQNVGDYWRGQFNM